MWVLTNRREYFSIETPKGPVFEIPGHSQHFIHPRSFLDSRTAQ